MVVFPISDAIGIWEGSLTTVIMVLSWVIIRTSKPMLAFIFGFYFDGCIPLQYHCKLPYYYWATVCRHTGSTD